MKVIWRNNKSVEVGTKNTGFGCGSNYGLNKAAQQRVLAKTRGYSHHALQDQHQSKNKPSEESGLVVPWPESGDALKPACRVCGRADDLRTLDTCDCHQLLQNCFGVKVVDISAKICQQCAELMLHTQKFKDMVCAAFQPSSEATLKTAESLLSIAQQNGYASGSAEVFVSKITLNRKAKPETAKPATKKMIATCTICKQKYPMPNTTSDFVCSRCKILNASDRTVACVKCRANVPSALMRDHLEIHAKANLKGRCRLRSLTKNPSKARTTDCVPRKPNQLEMKCTRCYKQFTSSQRLDEHLKASHGDFNQYICQVCGKDMISSIYLERHMKVHATIKTFECEFCGKIFKSISAMQRHTSVRHGEQNMF